MKLPGPAQVLAADNKSMKNLLKEIEGVFDMLDPDHENYNDSCADFMDAMCQYEKRVRAFAKAV